MEVFVQLVDKENAPTAPTTGAKRGPKSLTRDSVTGPFLYNNVVNLQQIFWFSPVTVTVTWPFRDRTVRDRTVRDRTVPDRTVPGRTVPDRSLF